MNIFKIFLNKINKFNDFIDSCFFNDYTNWILWIPIIFTVGILTYFRFTYYNVYVLIITIILSIAFIILFNISSNLTFKIISIIFITLISGYTRTGYYVNKINTPKIKEKMGYNIIYGVIDGVDYYQNKGEDKKRIIVKVDKIKRYNSKNENKNKKIYNNTRKNKKWKYIKKYNSNYDKNGFMINPPKYLRININNKTYKPKNGDYIEVKATLIPIPKKAFAGAYDPERYFYFQQIGGIGYNGYISYHEDRKEDNIFDKFKNASYNNREKINNRIIDAVGEKTGSIIGSFITGIKGRIEKEDYENMSYAGLTHLIAISGLNMAIIMGLIFISIRFILVNSEYCALNYDIKKISSIFAIVVGFLYLSITGYPVSANRAYLMSLLFFFGILIDRETDTMRFLAFVAMLILFDSPQLVFDAGFQLSFLAVLGLISGFKLLKKYEITFYSNKLYLKPILYMINILVSSIFAEISVLPLVIYHFNIYSSYSLLSNLIAIPITNFITLPFATFSIFLIPFNLEKYLLIPASWSVKIILNLSNYISTLPNYYRAVESPNLLGLSLMIIGFIWFCLWEEKWRYLGIILFVLGVLISPFKSYPDLIVDRENKFIVIIANNNLYFSNNNNKYKTSIIKRKFGKKHHKYIKEYCNKHYDKEKCILFINNIKEIFKDDKIIQNIKEMNNKYNIFDKEFKLLIN